MRRTPEQLAAQKRLQDALEDYVKVWRPSKRDAGELVTDWALVACSTSYDSDGDRISAYDLCYSDMEIDEHRALGLFNMAAHLCLFGSRVDDDD